MTDDTLIEKKAVDGFKTESPIRAFTDFQIAGSYAIGKGFRPSLAHMARYLDAMLAKEGWGLLQVILPRDSDGDPTILFERAHVEHPALGAPYGRDHAIYGAVKATEKDMATIRAAIEGDPINPAHYDGRACADIGERLSANGYQILKYVWRLGLKDDPCVEIGKAIWYCESEAKLIGSIRHVDVNKARLENADDFLENRITEQPVFTQNIARMLWQGYNGRRLQAVHEALLEHSFHLDCGRGLAI